MGDKLIIVIPTNYHKEIKSLKGKQVRIRVDDKIWIQKKKKNLLSYLVTPIKIGMSMLKFMLWT
jgi:antitoxin component of MazEF toxin-antitoxin module